MMAIALFFFAAGEPAPDAARQAWQLRREVRQVPTAAPAPEYARLPIPPEVMVHSQRGLADLRLIDAGGQEVPYLMVKRAARTDISRDYGRLSGVVRVKKKHSQWLVDFDEARTFDKVVIEHDLRDQAKTVSLELADRAQGPFRHLGGGTLFDQAWGGSRVHNEEIALTAQVTARFVRVTLDDSDKQPVTIDGVVVTRAQAVEAERFRHPVALGEGSRKDGLARLVLAWPRSLAVDQIVLQTRTPRFFRRVRLVEERESGRRVLGEEVVYRFAASEGGVPAERLVVPISHPEEREGGAVLLEIDHGDSPELLDLAVSASGPMVEAYYASEARPTVLYYGNPQARVPSYDLERYGDAITSRPVFVEARLGGESKNPLYARPQPLALVGSRGASLAHAQRWRRSRPLLLSGGPDLYGFLLDAQDLAWLRPDLGDLRVVDAEDHQVPYVIDTRRQLATTPLSFQREERKGTVSRYRIATGPSPDVVLPLTGLELDVAQDYFSRPVTLYAPVTRRGEETEEVVFSGRLARNPPADQEPSRLHFPEARHPFLVLAIDEGDNDPLVMNAVRGMALVPRVAFKWDGEVRDLRLLLGNAEAERPAYDLEMLRAELLAYDTVRASLGDAQPNPHYRRPFSDYFRGGSSLVVLWVTLAVLVVGLLLLTARLLREEKAAGK